MSVEASSAASAGTSPSAPAGRVALRRSWHPVAWAAELRDQPRRVVLLGEPVVLWRDGAGEVRALRDVCIHRGTALSLGRVVGGELMCPYHGWRYGADGRCTAIPQLPDPARVRAGAPEPLRAPPPVRDRPAPRLGASGR